MLCETESFSIHQGSPLRSNFHLSAFFNPLISQCVNCLSKGIEAEQRYQKRFRQAEMKLAVCDSECHVASHLGISHPETRKAVQHQQMTHFGPKNQWRGGCEQINHFLGTFLHIHSNFCCMLVLLRQHLTGSCDLMRKTTRVTPNEVATLRSRIDVMTHSDTLECFRAGVSLRGLGGSLGSVENKLI